MALVHQELTGKILEACFALAKEHSAQAINYLKATGVEVGLLVYSPLSFQATFNSPSSLLNPPLA